VGDGWPAELPPRRACQRPHGGLPHVPQMRELDQPLRPPCSPAFFPCENVPYSFCFRASACPRQFFPGFYLDFCQPFFPPSPTPRLEPIAPPPPPPPSTGPPHPNQDAPSRGVANPTMESPAAGSRFVAGPPFREPIAIRFGMGGAVVSCPPQGFNAAAAGPLNLCGNPSSPGFVRVTPHYFVPRQRLDFPCKRNQPDETWRVLKSRGCPVCEGPPDGAGLFAPLFRPLLFWAGGPPPPRSMPHPSNSQLRAPPPPPQLGGAVGESRPVELP